MKKVLKSAALGVMSAVMLFNCAFSAVGTNAYSQDDASFLISEEIPSETDEVGVVSSQDGSVDNLSEEILVEESSASESYSDETEIVVEDAAEELAAEDTDEVSVFTADTATSGKCGTSANWDYSASNKTLTISGKGAITDFSPTNEAPWESFREEIEHIVIKDGITIIGSYAFYKCKKVYEIKWPNSITDINDYAFCGISTGYSEKTSGIFDSVKFLDFPTSLKSIGKHAFSDSYYFKLNMSSLPSCITIIDDYAFYWNLGMRGNLKLTNNCKKLGYRAFYCAKLDGCVTIPSSITEVPSECFLCSGITGLVLPDNLKCVGSYAFDGCSKLDLGEFIFPSALESTEWESFDSVHFTKITFGKNVKSIQGFSYTPGSWVGNDKGPGEDLTIIFKGDLPEFPIDRDVLQFDCFNVTAYYPKDNDTWDSAKLEDISRNFFNVTWVKEGEKPAEKKDNLTCSYDEGTNTLIVSGTGRMRDYSVAETKPWSDYLPTMKKVVIGDDVESIGNNAFYDAKNLEEITIGKSVKEIGKNAFVNSSIKEFRFPKSLEKLSVKSLAIWSLKNIYFEGNPPEMTDEADASFLEVNVYYPADNDKWTEEYAKDFIEALSTKQFDDIMFFPDVNKDGNSCGERMTWKYEDGVVTISGSGKMTDYRFGRSAPWMEYRNKIKEVKISEGVTSIGAFAFYGIGYNNISMNVPSTVKRIEERAFSNVRPKGTGIVFHNNCKLEYVGKRAFYNTDYNITGLEKAMYNADLIDEDAFYGSNLSELDDLEINAKQLAYAAFMCCYRMKSVKIGPDVEKIGSSAFYADDKIAKVDIEEGVKTIGNSAFGRVVVDELVIPDSVEILGSEACPSVRKKLFVGKNITSAKGFNLKNYSVDVYFSGNYANLTSIKNLYQNIHYPRYNGSWIRGLRQLGASNLTFIPEGEEKDISCTVKFVTGTDKTFPDKTVKFGEIINIPVVEKEGHILEGWYTEKEFVNKADNPYEVFEDTTLYARWLSEKEFSWGDVTEEDREEKGFENPSDVEDKVWIAGVPESVEYSGKVVTFSTLHVYSYKTLLKQGKDYTLKYTGNNKAGTAKVTAILKGNYKGTEECNFEIEPLNIYNMLGRVMTLEDGTKYSLNMSRTYYVPYDGKVHKIKPSMTLTRNGKKIAFRENKDYVLKYPSEYDYKGMGSHVVYVVGKGNYTDDFSVGIVIEKKELISKATASKLPVKLATGSSVTLSDDELKVSFKGKKLSRGQDYTVSYTNNRYAGTAKVIITGTGKYFGKKEMTFKIKGKPVSKCYFTGFDKDVVYVDTGAKLSGVGMYADDKMSEWANGYDLIYSNNKKPGKGTVTIKGRNYYEGTVKKTFNIVGAPINKLGIVKAATSVEYTGEPITQDTLQLWDDQKQIYPEKNYYGSSNYYITSKYVNNVNVGTAKYILHGVRYYCGDRTISYKITPFVVNKERVEEGRIVVKMAESYKFIKGGVKPVPEVYFLTGSGKRVALTNKKDYTLTYKNARKKGTASVKLAFKGNFKGTYEKTYEITAAE